ncbi:hypothetical protein PCL_07364 [Purpureocillium lilacinum]|uniref:Uncharacterized protein n=1 Tax=Purpureocillium lilacinum TaxID=33203 RepID=A0A2U3DSF6_PURLI|nr:hypothetical protein PCL_07364 [Purpureocillium lilacinum]
MESGSEGACLVEHVHVPGVTTAFGRRGAGGGTLSQASASIHPSSLIAYSQRSQPACPSTLLPQKFWRDRSRTACHLITLLVHDRTGQAHAARGAGAAAMGRIARTGQGRRRPGKALGGRAETGYVEYRLRWGWESGTARPARGGGLPVVDDVDSATRPPVRVRRPSGRRSPTPGGASASWRIAGWWCLPMGSGGHGVRCGRTTEDWNCNELRAGTAPGATGTVSTPTVRHHHLPVTNAMFRFAGSSGIRLDHCTPKPSSYFNLSPPPPPHPRQLLPSTFSLTHDRAPPAPGPGPPTTTTYHENLRDPSVHGPPAHHSGAMALFVDILRPPRARAGPGPPPPFSPARCIHSPWLQQLRPAFQVTAAAAARAKSRQQPGRPPTAAGRPGDAPSLAGRRGSGSPPPLSPMASPPEKDAMWPAWKPRSPWAARVRPPNVR